MFVVLKKSSHECTLLIFEKHKSELETEASPDDTADISELETEASPDDIADIQEPDTESVPEADEMPDIPEPEPELPPEEIPDAPEAEPELPPEETPDAPEAEIAALEARIQAMPAISNLLRSHDHSKAILDAIYGQDQYKILEESPLAFHCDCSRDRFSDGIKSLGKTEIESLITENHGAEIICQFCETVYDFSENNLKDLIKNDE